MASRIIRIAVASDLHAVSGDSAVLGRSHLNASESEQFPSRHPVAGLLKLITDENLKADALICPGDIGDQANPDGIRYAWNALHRIGKALGASVILGTTGNHDVDSRRKYNEYDPVEVLKGLNPSYPLSDELLNGQYWMHNFAVCELNQCRIIALNSSAFHGGSEAEQQRGRISIATIEKLRTYLRDHTPKTLNIVVCHHHPQQHAELKLGDYDWMREGQEFLDLLGDGAFGNWVVIHGHKHHPKLSYAAGGVSSPVVFSAGSFAAVLYAELGTAARNQFYQLTLDLDKVERYGAVGTGVAWDWASTQGWVPASSGSGLPASFGFGCRADLVTLSHGIEKFMEGKQLASWGEVVDVLPLLSYVIPKDLQTLNRLLGARNGIQLLFDRHSRVHQVGKSSPKLEDQ